jgi:hypothetical protein
MHVRVIRTLDKGEKRLFMADRPNLSSERMLRKDYGRKGSVAINKSLVMSLEGLGERQTDWW